MIDLQSSGKTMIHLKFKHYMLDYNQQDEPVADVVVDKDEYLEAARTFYPAPASGPIPEYPDYSKNQSDDNQGYSPGEDTDTSTESIHQPGERNEPNKEPEG